MKQETTITITDVHLTAPDFSPANIKGYTVGVRPCRQTGIRLESEWLGHQLIVHNYGYGGAGLTLCWGGASEVLSLLSQAKVTPTQTIAVLGAGVIGLSTAFELLNAGYQVNIYAAAFTPHLTSNIAAGILGPTSVFFDPTVEQKKTLEKLLKISLARYLKSANAEQHEFAGMQFYMDYAVEVPGGPSRYRQYLVLPTETKHVRIHFDNGVTKLGTQKKEFGLDGKLFMADLHEQVLNKGAQFYYCKLIKPEDISSLSESIVINCTSLGSRELFNDKTFIPIRGHLIYLNPQSKVDYAFYQNVPEATNYWVQLYPWEDRLIVGGVFENDVDENKIDKNVIQQLQAHAQKCFTA